VRTSRTGHQVHFNGKALVSEDSCHMDMDTRDIYWVSGVRKDGTYRH